MKKVGHIKPLTSLRFVFAFWVFLSHVDHYINSTTLDLPWIDVLSSIFSEGYLGVTFFFILSGFVLALSYQSKFELGLVDAKEFWIGRFKRIFPLHLLTLIIAVPFVILGVETISKAFIQVFNFFINTLMIQSFVPVKGVYFGYNSPAWSISNEMFFYLLTPFLLKITTKGNSLFYCLLILTIVYIMTGYVLPEGYHHALLYINPVFRLSDFLVGIIVFRFWIKRGSSKDKRISFALETLSLLLFAFVFFLCRDWPQFLRYSLIYWLPMGLIIYVVSSSAGPLVEILSYRPLVYLGKVSFSFYLIHLSVIKYTELLYDTLFSDYNTIGIVLFSLIVSVGLSIITYELFEKRFLRNSYVFLRSLSTKHPYFRLIKRNDSTSS
jgi:peptidoglycan/LPS O-acetylase OafA/YrhL